jgi:hypothetical protein
VNNPRWDGPQRPASPQRPRGTVYRSATHSTRTARRRLLGRLALVALLLAGVGTAGVVVAGHRLSAAAHAGRGGVPAASTAAAGAPVLTPRTVDVSVDGFLSWALLDRRTGAISGSANHAGATSSTESMIKVWIAADHLRQQAAGGRTPNQQRLAELTTMIRDSDDRAAEDIYRLDGGNAVVTRMISTCGLTGTTAVNGWWSRTQVTADDAARLGLCVADGRAAGRTWTSWILTQMRQVRGEGRFGVVDALPAGTAATTAIKNGWTLINADGSWHVACLAVQDRWVLAVLTRYDGSRGLSYGAGVCADVTRQLMTDS